MTAGLWQPAGVRVSTIRKEVRALLPPWLASTFGVGAAAIVDPPAIVPGVFACALGAIAIGAPSIGHEYSHRTLGLLLSQPCDRRRTYLTKLGVLAGMLLTLGAVAWIALAAGTGPVRLSLWDPPRVVLLAALFGFFVAPWMTMVCRGPLPGMVFTVVIPLALLTLGDLIGTARYGLGGGAAIDRFKLAFLWWGAFVVCAIAAVSGWRMFMRLEAIDGRGAELGMPAWPRGSRTVDRGRAVAGRRHALWLLAKKELHLQQMTFVVVALYVFGWGTMSVLERVVPGFTEIPIGPVTFLYFALVSMLIGSLASAEERQFGTLEWHALLPVATWQQWSMKAGIALALALAAAIGLPAALPFINPPVAGFRVRGEPWMHIPLTVGLLTTCSLYISSLCGSGVRAMVLSLPSVLGALAFIRFVSDSVFWWVDELAADGIRAYPYRPAQLWLLYALAIGFAALLLRFGLANHRSAERGGSRTSRQLVSVAAFLALAVILDAGYRVFSAGR